MSVAFRCAKCGRFFDGTSFVRLTTEPWIGLSLIEMCEECCSAFKRWFGRPDAPAKKEQS